MFQKITSTSKKLGLSEFVDWAFKLELHPTNVSVIVDADDNPQMDCGSRDTYSGNFHQLYIECTYVIVVYCKRSSCGYNHFFVH